MSKKYFTKYLPVEGEIKMGDNFFEPRLGIGTRRNKEGLYDFQKVKLFLCSRDIQVGDKCWNSLVGFVEYIGKDQNGHLFKDDRPNPWCCDELLFKDFIKVIGEISPDALSYVKEGMEFDEDQIQRATKLEIYYADASEQWQTSTIVTNVDESYSPKKGVSYNEDIIDERIEIKCSCCGKFN